uniref:Uncharacterized protein n=1 Tax=Tanacetum cinerariifolium TaxID=118510 RepID=A0A699J665_TANCI|nr:hypothetical protein [Tanacetum cinerariifolium]
MVAQSLSQEFNRIKCHIDASMLSVGTMYEANLVFRFHEQPIADLIRLQLMTIKWRTQEMSVCSTHVAELTLKPSVSSLGLLIQGIEFQPTDMNEGIEGFECLTITDEEDKDNDDAYWEKKLPNDYHRCIDMLRKPLHYTTKKDLCLLFCHGFLGDNGQLSFSLCKTTGKICSMLRAIDIVHHVDDYNGLLHSLSLPESRFGKVTQLQDAEWFRLEYRLRSHVFSPDRIIINYGKHTPYKAGGPLGAASLPSGRGKAVYISPPPLARGRRDWIRLT